MLTNETLAECVKRLDALWPTLKLLIPRESLLECSLNGFCRWSDGSDLSFFNFWRCFYRKYWSVSDFLGNGHGELIEALLDAGFEVGVVYKAVQYQGNPNILEDDRKDDEKFQAWLSSKLKQIRA